MDFFKYGSTIVSRLAVTPQYFGVTPRSRKGRRDLLQLDDGMPISARVLLLVLLISGSSARKITGICNDAVDQRHSKVGRCWSHVYWAKNTGMKRADAKTQYPGLTPESSFADFQCELAQPDTTHGSPGGDCEFMMPCSKSGVRVKCPGKEVRKAAVGSKLVSAYSAKDTRRGCAPKAAANTSLIKQTFSVSEGSTAVISAHIMGRHRNMRLDLWLYLDGQRKDSAITYSAGGHRNRNAWTVSTPHFFRVRPV